MSELEMLKQVNQQSLQTYGSLSEDYTTIPIPQISQTREQILSEYKAGIESATTTSATDVVESVPTSGSRLEEEPTEETEPMPISPEATPTTKETINLTDTTKEKETYSHDMTEWQPVPIGSVPPGYKAGKICGNCMYFCCGICGAHDFPAHCTYVCDDHRYVSEGEVMGLSEETNEVEQYAEGRTDGGNVTAEARANNATLSGGRFPIFDKKSAQSALKLRGKTKTKKERNKVIAKASKFAPKAADEAKEKDKETKGKKEKLSYMPPSEPRLWDIAVSRTNGDEELASEIYRQLYAELFGTEDAQFGEVYVDESSIITEDTDVVIEEKEEGQTLSVEFGASISAPQMVDAGYVGPTEEGSKKTGTLFAIAETRIKAKYRKSGKDIKEVLSSPKYIEEVQKEYERLVIARSQ